MYTETEEESLSIPLNSKNRDNLLLFVSILNVQTST